MINKLAFGICVSLLTITFISFSEGKWIAVGQNSSNENRSELLYITNDSNLEDKPSPVVNGSLIITPWNTGNKNGPYE